MSTHYEDNPSPAPPTVTPLYGDPPLPMLPNLDARTHALRSLAAWFSSLVFRRTMMEGQEPQAFSVTPDRVFIEQPDSVENLQFPSIGILPARGQYYTRGIGGADPDGETVDGYSLLVPWDYQEMLTVEVMGSKIAERRAMVAGIEAAMGTYQGTTDLRLVMPSYYGLVATYSLMERENLEDAESPRGRRRAHLYIQMLVPVVTQARMIELQATIAVSPTINVGADIGVNFVASQVTEAARAFVGVQALAAMRLTLTEAKTIARATLGINRLQADALSIDYLVALMQSLAAQNANLRTATTP